MCSLSEKGQEGLGLDVYKRQVQTPTGGSSGEYWAMGETLTQQRRVREEGFRIVNLCPKRRGEDGILGGSPG